MDSLKTWVGLENYKGVLGSINILGFHVEFLLVYCRKLCSVDAIILRVGIVDYIEAEIHQICMKTAYFMPVILGTTTVALMWTYILNPEWGALARLRASWKNMLYVSLAAPTVNVWCVVLVNQSMYAE